MSAFYPPPPPDDNHSHLVARRSGSLNGFVRFAPLYIALMGIFFTPTVFAGANRWDCDYWSAEENAIDCGYNNNSGLSDVGKASVALGHSNWVSGDYSSAVGYSNMASGLKSSAVGYDNYAYGENSSAVGYYNTAGGINSHAFGGWNNRSDIYSKVTVGRGSVAVGFKNNYKDTGEVTVGEYSSAVGVMNTASGVSSTALGNSNTASGNQSTAVGFGNTAAAASASVFGRENNYSEKTLSMGAGAVALGVQNNSSGQNVTVGQYSTVVGSSNNASNDAVEVGQYATAVGRQNTTSKNYSSAFGYKNTASGQYSSAFGSQSQAVVDYGSAIGYKSYADRAAWDSSSNNYSAAFVPSDMSSFSNQQKAAWQATSAALAVGDPKGTGGTVITRQITGVAAGSENTDAVNVAQLKAAGTAAQDWVNAQGFAKAIDVATQITAAGTAAKDWVNAQGFAKAADLPCSYDANGNLSCGKNANNGVSASTQDATVLGIGNNESVFGNTTVGNKSLAVGFGNNRSETSDDITVGENSTAVGFNNKASSNHSTAVGYSNTASGQNSSAVGYNNTASEQYSSAVGYNNAANAEGSSAVGYQNIANEWMSSAFGSSSQAVVAFGTAIGYKSYADRAAWNSSSNNYSAAFAPSDMSGFDAKQKAAWQATSAALAVGDPDSKGYKAPITRQITGVAAGSEDTDAVNVAQLVAAGTAAKDWVDNQGFAKAADVPCSYDANGNLSCGNNKDNGVSASTRNATVLGTSNNESFSGSTTVGDYSVAVGINNNYSYSEDITVGAGSTAVGYSNNASGKHSSAVGYGNKASDKKSTAMGYQNTATLGSTALGSENNAEGATTSFVMTGSPTIRQYPSLAVGNENNATVGATALGSYNTATGVVYDSSNPPSIYSTSIAPALAVGVGNTATATGRNSAIAMGIRNTANANGVVAVGYNNTASGNYSSVFGAKSQAIVDYGTAIGYQSYADRADLKVANEKGLYAPANFDTLDEKGKAVWQSTSAALAVGDANGDGNSSGTPITRQITGVAAGSEDTDAVNVAQLKEVAALASGGSFSPISVSGNSGSFTVGSAGSLKMVGSNANLSTKANGDTVTFTLADDLNLTSVNTGGVQMSATGLVMSNQKITGLANGTANTDAVNLGQLNTSINTAAAAATTALNTAKSELEGKITAAESSAKGYTDTALGSYAKTSDLAAYAKTSDLAPYAKTADLAAFAKTSDLAPYAKTADVTSQINSAKTAATTALNNAKTDLQGKIDTANSEIGSLKTDKADKSWVTTELAKVSSGGTVDLSDYATKTYADNQANAAQTNANAYTDSKVSGLAKQADLTAVQGEVGSLKTDLGNKADKTALDGKADKSWVTTELAKVSSGGAIDLSDYAQKDYADNAANTAETNAKGYTDSEMAKAKSYADTAANTAETNAKGYTDDEVAKAKSYADTAANTAETNAKGYTDSEMAKAKSYADTAASQAKTDAVADANAYTDTALSDNATQTWVNNQKFAKEQTVSDLNSRVDKLVVAGGGYEHITVAGENGSFNVANKETAKFVGDGKNITTDATGGEVKISLADDIAVNSVNAGGTVVNQNGVTLPSGVALTQNGLNNGGQVISNVAAGSRPTDAVNVAQLNNSVYASEARMTNRIDSVSKHANAGTAQALAAANMPTASQPGEGMLAISGGVYRGEQGYAIGYSQLSENGRWVIRATGSGNSRNHFGGAVGVGFKLF